VLATTAAKAKPTATEPSPELKKTGLASVPSDQPNVVAKSTNNGKVFNKTAKRDPFLTIIQSPGQVNTSCTTGKKCLVIGQIVLKGIVKSGNGMLALVENQYRKAYFLRENDPVFNGQVVKITADSVVFRETVVDRVGRESAREVVKKVGKTA
jgi:hypothetical protein